MIKVVDAFESLLYFFATFVIIFSMVIITLPFGIIPVLAIYLIIKAIFYV